MDDQQGNVIDGTERARQWRRSRSNARAGEEDGEPRSDAPKSIASSLLVPADMVHDAIAPTVGDRSSPGEEIGPDDESADRASVPSGGATLEGEEHRNPFLASAHAGAGATGEAVQSSKRRSMFELSARIVGAGRRRRSVRPPRNLLAAIPHRRARAITLARPVVVALGVLGLIAIGVEVLTQTQNGSVPVHSPGGSASAVPLDRWRPPLLSSVVNPLAGARTTRRPRGDRAGRAPAHQASANPRKARTPTITTAVPARYTPPSSPSSLASGSGSAPSHESSGAAATSSAQPAAQPSTASSRSTSAFGASGALGPGSSPNG